ncbi:MAG: hypothetical protein C4319_00360 [Acidimicrobiia bacterium]
MKSQKVFEAEESKTLEIDAPVEVVYEVITDFERYPEWARSLRKVVVHDGLRSGAEACADSVAPSGESYHPAEVEFFGGAMGFHARYRLRYKFDPPTKLEWDLVDGEVKGLFLKFSISSLNGSYVFEPTQDGRALATYTLRVAFPVALGPLRKKAEEIVMETGLKDLKYRAEWLASTRRNGSG